MDAPIETFEVNGLTVSLYLDDNPANPRKDLTQFSGLYTWSRNYISPDPIEDFPTQLADAQLRWLNDAFDGTEGTKFLRYVRAFHADTILVAVALTHEENGLSSYTIDDLPRYWRGSRFTGIGLVTREGWVQAMGEEYRGDVTPEQLLADEIKLYNAYANGDCYGYVITDKSGKELESLWGMYEGDDDNYVRRAATEAAQGCRSVPVTPDEDQPRPLTADQIHVLLDVITYYRNPESGEPWSGYDSDPQTDPKASEAGWTELLDSADLALNEILGTL